MCIRDRVAWRLVYIHYIVRKNHIQPTLVGEQEQMCIRDSLKVVETDEIHRAASRIATKFLCRKMKKSLFDFLTGPYYHDFKRNANDFIKNIQDH